MILMIDDEPYHMRTYIDELEFSGYQVKLEKDADAAFKFLTENKDRIRLVILDIMMASGRLLADVDTQNGLRTGVHLFDRIRALAPELPILILTNVSDPRVAARFQGQEKCRFLRKEDYLPFELAEEVRRFFWNHNLTKT